MKYLGKKSILTARQLAEPRSILDTFANPKPGRPYEIEFTFGEYTSVCPVTGQPDFGTITVSYIPRRRCVEMKSLKLYFFSYRNRGIFFEAAVNAILDDLAAALLPRWMRVKGEFTARGGTQATVIVSHGKLPGGFQR